MTEQLAPVVATVTVPAGPELAFEVFTDGMGSWWPLGSHSLGGARIAQVVVEPQVGGSVVEVWDDGTRKAWAEVLVWDPPRRLALAWNPSDEPETRESSLVDITFVPAAAGTLVTVTHTGWDTWGAELREGYAEGWPIVLSGYVAQVAR